MIGLISKKLGLKLSFWLSVIFICIFSLLTIFNIVYQSRIIKEHQGSAVSELTTTLLGAIRYPMIKGEQEVIQKQLEMIKSSNPQLVVHVCDDQGVIKRTTDKERLGAKTKAAGLEAALNGKEVSGIEYRQVVGYRVFEELKPILNEPACLGCHGKEKEVLGVLRIASDYRPVEAALRVSRNANIGFAVLAIIVVIGLLNMLTAVMLSPVGALEIVAQEVAKGDLSKSVQVTSQDEIGRVAGSFNAVIAAFRNVAASIMKTAEQVLSSAQNFMESTEAMNKTTVDVSEAMNKITKGVTTQTKKIEETGGIMGQMTASLRTVSQQSHKVADLSGNASEQVNISGVKMTGMSEKIERISVTVNEAVQLIKVLGDRSQQIGEITEAITSIADQTNLLALNAAIEAARAGESGRGFAVVAEEVRKLAENSAQAASRIGGLIKNVQGEVKKTIVAIEEGSEEVKEGRKVGLEVSAVLKNVITVVNDVARMAGEISQSINDQLSSTEKVGAKMREVAAVAEETAHVVEETSASVEEQSAGMQEMASSAQTLTEIARQMKELGSKFKT